MHDTIADLGSGKFNVGWPYRIRTTTSTQRATLTRASWPETDMRNALRPEADVLRLAGRHWCGLRTSLRLCFAPLPHAIVDAFFRGAKVTGDQHGR